MKKIVKIFKLSDPYPDFGYEIACYIKAVLGTFLFLIGIFLIIFPQGYFGFFLWGIIFLGISLFFFWRIKLIRKLIKILL